MLSDTDPDGPPLIVSSSLAVPGTSISGLCTPSTVLHRSTFIRIVVFRWSKHVSTSHRCPYNSATRSSGHSASSINVVTTMT